MKNKSNASLSLRKLLLSALVAAPLATLPVPLWALPADQATLNGLITPSSGVSATWIAANRVDVTSTATNGVLKWTDFGGGTNTISSGDVVNYTLPSTSASILNMVTGTNATTINGKLNANGNLYVLNPNGITVGGTGVITANSVGLSTIPETEYYFLNTGSLSLSTNNAATVTQPVTVQSGATITAASGTGNVWVAGNGASLAGTIDAGSLSVKSIGGGAVVLSAGGALTVGDSINKVGNVTVTTDAATGTITIGDAVANASTTIYGPSVSLTSGNAAISSAGTGVIQIGSGSADATLTTNSGTAATTFTSNTVSATGSKTLNVNATTSGASGDVSVKSASDLTFTGSVGDKLALTTTTGNVTLNTATVTDTVAVTSAGAIKSGGTLTNTAGKAIGLTAAAGKDITLNVKNDISAGALTLTGPSAGSGNVTLTSTSGNIALDAYTTANLSVTAAGDITQTATKTITTDNTANTVSITSTGGNVTLSEQITAKNLTVSANKLLTQQTNADAIAGNVSLTAGTDLSIGAGLGAATKLTTSSGGNTTISADLSASSLTSASLTATGDLKVAAFKATTLTAKGNNISETGVITATTATVDGNTSVDLTGANNAIGTLIIKNAPNGASVNSAGGLTIGNGTAATGNVTITASKTTAGDVVFGALPGDTMSFGKILTIDNTTTANGNISDLSDNISVTGNVTLKVAGTGAVTLDGSNGNGIGLHSTYGQVNINSAATDATIFSAGTLNLGTITLNAGANNLKAYSTSDVTNSGALTVNNITVGAGTATAPGNIWLANYSSTGPVVNMIHGTVSILTDLQLVGSASVGNYLVKDLTIANGFSSANLLSLPANIYSAGIAGNVSLRTYGAANLNVTGDITTTGPVSLQSDTGSINLSSANNTFTNVMVTTNNTTAASSIAAKGDLTVNGNVSGTSNKSLTFTSGGNLTIGSYNSLGSGTTAFTTGTGWIADSTPGIFIYGDVSFTGGSVNITKSGHNFGGITIDTHTNNGNATINEGGTSRFVSVNTGSGYFASTSANGDVLAHTGTITSSGAVNLSASNGKVTADNAANAITGNVTLTAVSNSALSNNADIKLGTVSVSGGTLAVTTAAAGQNITQGSGTINVYGATSFTTTGAGKITIGNSGNQLGAVTASTGTGNITVKEATTLNLAGVTTTGGAVSLTSENGDVMDSGALTLGTSAVSFNAPNGNINLTKNSTFASAGTVGVSFNTAGNVSVKSAGSIQFDTSTVTGTFTASATGHMTQLGSLIIGGDVTLTPTGYILFTNTANQFGAFRFTVSGASIIDEATTFNLKAGSFATAAVTINTNSDFITSGAGGSSFTGTGLTINAPSGTISPGAGSLLVTGTLTVNSNVKTDLHLLSKSGNLNGNNPVYQGTGANGSTDSTLAPAP